MKVIALFIFANLKYYGVEITGHPADSAILLRNIGPLVEVIRMRENLLHFLKTDPALGIGPQLIALRGSNRYRIWYNCYTTKLREERICEDSKHHIPASGQR